MDFYNQSASPEDWAFSLGISREAIRVYLSCELIDLHIEAFMWTRILGYNLMSRHGHGILDARFYSQTDFPRMLEARMTGGVWSIVTNPIRRRQNRTSAFLRNLNRIRSIIKNKPGHLQLVADYSGYRHARKEGKYACWLGIQGGNALDSGPRDLELIPENCISRITLVHYSNSSIGTSSSPLSLSCQQGLTEFGISYVKQMNELNILVDLAHINKQGFWDAIKVHDRSKPVIVSHTGVCGVNNMWRNIDDDQIRAIADTGGIIGIIFHSGFLGDSHLKGGTTDSIVQHMEHVISVVGEDYVGLGSDWDGGIITPRDMKTVLELPVLVQKMLDAGWSAERIQKIMGGNYLRVMKHIRPGDHNQTNEKILTTHC